MRVMDDEEGESWLSSLIDRADKLILTIGGYEDELEHVFSDDESDSSEDDDSDSDIDDSDSEEDDAKSPPGRHQAEEKVALAEENASAVLTDEGSVIPAAAGSGNAKEQQTPASAAPLPNGDGARMAEARSLEGDAERGKAFEHEVQEPSTGSGANPLPSATHDKERDGDGIHPPPEEEITPQDQEAVESVDPALRLLATPAENNEADSLAEGDNNSLVEIREEVLAPERAEPAPEPVPDVSIPAGPVATPSRSRDSGIKAPEEGLAQSSSTAKEPPDPTWITPYRDRGGVGHQRGPPPVGGVILDGGVASRRIYRERRRSPSDERVAAGIGGGANVDVAVPVMAPTVDVPAPVVAPSVDVEASMVAPRVDVVIPVGAPSVDTAAPVEAPSVDPAAPMMAPSVDIVAPMVAPRADVATPAVAPRADVAIPAVAPSADVATPAVALSADVATPAVAPSADVATPAVAPSADVATPAVAPRADVAVPVCSPSVDVVTPVVAPSVDAAVPMTAPSVEVTAPMIPPSVDMVAPVVAPSVNEAHPVVPPTVDLAAPVVAPSVDIETPVGEMIHPSQSPSAAHLKKILGGGRAGKKKFSYANDTTWLKSKDELAETMPARRESRSSIAGVSWVPTPITGLSTSPDDGSHTSDSVSALPATGNRRESPLVMEVQLAEGIVAPACLEAETDSEVGGLCISSDSLEDPSKHEGVDPEELPDAAIVFPEYREGGDGFPDSLEAEQVYDGQDEEPKDGPDGTGDETLQNHPELAAGLNSGNLAEDGAATIGAKRASAGNGAAPQDWSSTDDWALDSPEGFAPSKRGKARTEYPLAVMRHSSRLDDAIHERERKLEAMVVESGRGAGFADGSAQNGGGHDLDAVPWPDRALRPYDSPIVDTDLPGRQARDLGRLGFGATTLILCSPFRRCLQTAGIVARTLGVEGVTVHRGIGERMDKVRKEIMELTLARSARDPRGVGKEPSAVFSYLDEEDMVEALGAGVRLDGLVGEQPPEGESGVGAKERFIATIGRVREECLRESPVLLVAHGDTLDAAGESLASQIVFEADYCAWAVFDLDTYSGYITESYGIQMIPLL